MDANVCDKDHNPTISDDLWRSGIRQRQSVPAFDFNKSALMRLSAASKTVCGVPMDAVIKSLLYHRHLFLLQSPSASRSLPGAFTTTCPVTCSTRLPDANSYN